MKINELKEKIDEWRNSHQAIEWDKFPITDYVNIKEYVPIETKIDIAQKAAAELYEQEGGIRTYDLTSADIIYDLTAVSLYTDLDYDADESFEAYDILEEIGFFDYLRDVNEDEMIRFRKVFDNILISLVDDYNSLSAVLDRGLKRFEDRIATAIERLGESGLTMEEIEKMQGALQNINETMKKVEDVKAVDVIEAYKEN